MAFHLFYLDKNGDTDVLEKKKKELASCVEQYNAAIALVTGTVSNLHSLGESIAEKIKEIDEYQEELISTRDGLCKMKEKNDKVAANFSALLGE